MTTRTFIHNLLHVLKYGLSVTIITYPDQLPFIQLSWINQHIFKWHMEWVHRKAEPGKAYGFRTWGLLTPYQNFKIWLRRHDVEFMDF